MNLIEAFKLLWSFRKRTRYIFVKHVKKERFVSVVEEEEEEEGYSIENTFTILSRVYREERIELYTKTPRLVGTEIHALLLESGLVGIDPKTKTQIYRFNMPPHWPCSISPMDPLHFIYVYTLPQILQSNLIITDDLTFVLKFQFLGNTFRVSGPWTTDASRPRKYMYAMNFNLGYGSIFNFQTGAHNEKQIVALRKLVRNQLASRIKYQLRAKAGFPGPPLLDLPRDLQIKILSLLSREDVVNVGCVCRALNQLYRDDVLWEKILVETYGMDWNKKYRAACNAKYYSSYYRYHFYIS